MLINLIEGKLKSKEKFTDALLFLGRYLHFSELGDS
jgi:hypothetical protein